MTTHPQNIYRARAQHPPMTVAVVGNDAGKHTIETVLGAVDYDIVFVGSIAHAYSDIRRLTPDLVILCLSGQDEASCRLLSMLTMDAATSRIPVVTCMTVPPDDLGPDATDVSDDAFDRLVPVSMN